MHLMGSRAFSGGILFTGVLISLFLTHCSESAPVEPSSGIETETATAATFVGRQVCAQCHSKEVELWEGSHHDRAMQVVDENTVLVILTTPPTPITESPPPSSNERENSWCEPMDLRANF